MPIGIYVKAARIKKFSKTTKVECGFFQYSLDVLLSASNI